MNKQKLLSLSLAIIMLLALLTGCGTPANTPAEPDTAAIDAAVSAAVAEKNAEIQSLRDQVTTLESQGTTEPEAFDPSEIIDWYDDEANVGRWMTVVNDNWDTNPSSAPTDDEIKKMLNFALKSQTGIHWTETFFVVIRDVDEQHNIIGSSFSPTNDLDGCSNEGTVTILILADNILPQEQHATEYDTAASYFADPVMAPFDAGMTCGMFNVAATSMGYGTHYFAYPSGSEFAMADRSYNIDRYLDGKNYTRAWGITGKYTDDSTLVEYPVQGNVKFIAAVVVGTPTGDPSTHATMYARPDNYAFWDAE